MHDLTLIDQSEKALVYYTISDKRLSDNRQTPRNTPDEVEDSRTRRCHSRRQTLQQAQQLESKESEGT